MQHSCAFEITSHKYLLPPKSLTAASQSPNEETTPHPIEKCYCSAMRCACACSLPPNAMQLGFMFGAAAEEQHYYIEVLRPSSLFCPSIRPFVSFPCRQTQLHSKFIVFIYNWQKSNLLLLFQGNFGPTIRYRFSPCLEIIATRLIHRLIQCMSVVLRFSCSVACSPSWGVYFDLIITRSRKLGFEM